MKRTFWTAANIAAMEKRERWVTRLRGDLIAHGHRSPDVLEEVRFMASRRFRFDFAFPALRIGIEVEGGVHADRGDSIDVMGGQLVKREGRKSRHTTSHGYETDCVKYNHAQTAGWWVLRFTPRQIERGEAAAFIDQAVRQRRAELGK